MFISNVHAIHLQSIHLESPLFLLSICNPPSAIQTPDQWEPVAPTKEAHLLTSCHSQIATLATFKSPLLPQKQRGTNSPFSKIDYSFSKKEGFYQLTFYTFFLTWIDFLSCH